VHVDHADRRDQPAWIKAHAMENRKYRLEQAFEALYMPQQAPHGVPAEALEELYDFAASAIGHVPITYLEFGVASGRSLGRIAKRFKHPDARFFGFDSFEGLPEDWVLPWGTMSRGTFSAEGRPPDLQDSRITFVKGWFQNTLPDFLGRLQNSGVALVHFDADLYSATLFILASLWHKIPEYYFLFDEFLGDEIIALYDFSRAFPVELEFLCQTNSGAYPNQVFGRLKRIPLHLP
jgi:Macrocin-O-methyltransferase (TylF)